MGSDDKDELLLLRGTNSGALALSLLKDEFLERDGSDNDDAVDDDGEDWWW